MNLAGIGPAEGVVPIFNFAILAGWPLLALLAPFSLRQRRLAPATQALRALMIVAVPFLGALTSWIVRPGGDADPPRARTEGSR